MAEKPKPDNKAEIARRAAIIARAFGTKEGQEALKILIENFDGSCYARGDPHHTSYLEGARDVLTYIKQMTQFHEKGAK
jgi:hypothetical protein